MRKNKEISYDVAENLKKKTRKNTERRRARRQDILQTLIMEIILPFHFWLHVWSESMKNVLNVKAVANEFNLSRDPRHTGYTLCAEYKGADMMRGLAGSRSQAERLVLAYKVS